MRALTSAVLITEAITLGLAIPVALVAEDQPTWYVWLLAVLALVALLLPGFAKRPFFVPAGWLLQGAVLWAGVVGAITSQGGGVIPTLLVLGAVFTGLWWAALRLGRIAEQSRASQAPPT